MTPDKCRFYGIGHFVGIFKYSRLSAGEGYHYSCLVIIGNIGRDPFGEDALIPRIVRAYLLHNQAAVALQVVADNGNGLIRIAAADVEGVGSAAAHDFQGDIFGGTVDKEGIIAFECIDDNTFNAVVLYKESGTVDTHLGYYEVIAKLCTDNGNRVEAVTAFNMHRCIDRV